MIKLTGTQGSVTLLLSKITSFLNGTFAFVPLTRTHYSDLPLILEHAQICPFVVSSPYKNTFRSVFVRSKGFDRLLDVFRTLLPLPPYVIDMQHPL